MLKRLLGLVVAVAFAVGITACGGGTSPEPSKPAPTKAPEATKAAEPAKPAESAQPAAPTPAAPTPAAPAEPGK